MLHNTLKPIFFLAVLFLITRCNQRERSTEHVKVDTVVQTAKAEEHMVKAKPVFPDSAKRVEEFILEGYIIDMEAEGDLNKNSLADNVMVLIEKDDSLSERPVIILFQSKSGNYMNAGVSWTAVSEKYTSDLFKIYEYEEVKIDTNGTLLIEMSGTGPSGYLKTQYAFEEGVFNLILMETYHMGAGAHQGMEYDIKRSIITQTIVNTMKEDMPEETETIPYSFSQIRFDSANPDKIMEAAYNKAKFKSGF